MKSFFAAQRSFPVIDIVVRGLYASANVLQKQITVLQKYRTDGLRVGRVSLSRERLLQQITVLYSAGYHGHGHGQAVRQPAEYTVCLHSVGWQGRRGGCIFFCRIRLLDCRTRMLGHPLRLRLCFAIPLVGCL